MGLENSNPSQPLEPSGQPLEPSGQPAEPGQPAGQESDQARAPQPSNDSRSSDAPLDSSLLSMMQSLTPNAPATSGDSVPQYPSLEAAVGIEQPIAPTLTNLLAANTQATPNLGLGNPGLAVTATPAAPLAAQEKAPAVDEPENPTAAAPTNLATAIANGGAAESSPTPSSPSLADEQGPLGGQAIAVVPPEPDQEVNLGPASNLTQNDSPEADTARHVITQDQDPVTTMPSEASPRIVEAQEAAAPNEPSNELPSASQESPTAEDLAAEPQAEQPPAQADAANHKTAKNVGEGGNQADEAQAEDAQAEDEQLGENQPDHDDDFDQVKAGAAGGDRPQQVLIKREANHLAVIFPQEAASANPDIALDFIDSQIWQDLQQRLSGGTAFASDTPVHLYSQNSLLDTRQLQELDEALSRFNLKLVRIITSRRQTAVAAAMSGYSTDQANDLPELLSKEIHSPQKIGLAEPLYLQKNIRSGTEISHPGSVIVMGDLNPGSSVIADGDILVWGRLRGIAHAGAAGDTTSIVMALKLEAPQLRIAGAVARVDTQGKGTPSPEIAYINDKSIRITSAYGFNRNESS